MYWSWEKGMSEIRKVDDELSLVPYYPAYDITLSWYQDPETCRMCDNDDTPYDLERLKKMYGYLERNGDSFYIVYRDRLIGDIALQDKGEISIMLVKEFRSRHIGRKCVREILALAKEKGMKEVRARIYPFNIPSRKMFLTCGFRKRDEEEYVYVFPERASQIRRRSIPQADIDMLVLDRYEEEMLD